MTRVHRQRRQHWENFFLEILPSPGRAPRTKFRNFAYPNPIFVELWKQLLVKKVVLGRDQLMGEALNLVERFGRT